MTTKALLRTSSWDWDRARDHLHDQAAGAKATVGGHPIRLSAEPLIKRVESGAFMQSVRIEAPVPIASVLVRASDGTGVETVLLPAPGGLRVLVPETAGPRTLTFELPEFAPGVTVELEVAPQRHWDIHLVHHSHLDIGYTDPQGRVVAEQLSYLDSALDLVRATDGWDEDAQFRWVVESLWSFEQWAQNRPAAVVDEFLDRVREGRIELTAMPFNLHTEACSTDELHELLRIAADLRTHHGIPIRSAMQTDVPGSVGGLVDVLADQGVRYLSVAHNWAGRSVPHLTGGQDVPRLFWWQAPSGNRILVWVTDTPHGLAYMEGPVLGFDVCYEMVEDLLPAYLTSLANYPYPYDGAVFGFLAADVPLHREPYPWDILHMRVQGHFGDNAPPRRIMSETVRQWNETWTYPHLRLSRNEDFFADAEARYGLRIPTFTGDWNDWWAEGIGSAARPLQLVRHAQAALADAQTVSAIASTRGAADCADDTRDARGAYLMASLFDEHTWGAGDPWTHGDDHTHTHSGEEQWHWKYHTALAAHDDARTLRTRALSRLAGTLQASDGALGSLHVVNPTSHARSETVTAFVPESRIPLGESLTVTDARTGKTLAIEQSEQVNPDHREAGRFLHIAVDSVPPLSTVQLDLSLSTDAQQPRPYFETALDPTVLENEFLRVEVDLRHACIRSIIDRATGAELVAADSTFGFNAYIYDRLASAGGINHQSSKLEASDNLALLAWRELARPAALIDRGRSDVRQWLTYESVAPGADWVRTTLTLEVGSGTLQIENRISKNATMSKESAYFAFPFEVAAPTVRIDASGAVTGPDIEHVPGGAIHMQAIRRWVALHRNGLGIAWATADAALVQIGSIAIPYAPFPRSTPTVEPATIYSWVHNNLWDTNFPSQQAFEMSFHYRVAAVAVPRPDAASAFASRTAASVVHPLLAVLAPEIASSSVAGRRLEPQPVKDPPGSNSTMTLSDERIRVLGLTVPRQGQMLVRLQSVCADPIDCVLSLNLEVARAWNASMLGEARSPITIEQEDISVSVPPFGVAAVLLELNRIAT